MIALLILAAAYLFVTTATVLAMYLVCVNEDEPFSWHMIVAACAWPWVARDLFLPRNGDRR